MTISLEAIITVIIFALTSLVGTAVWLVRLEGKLKQLKTEFVNCRSVWETRRVDALRIQEALGDKLEELLRAVARIEGRLTGAANEREEHKK